MQRIAAGDEVALEDLMAAYWQPLVAFSSRVLQQPDAAEDVALETFAQLWERRAEWRQQGSPRVYLFRVARNRALNEQRHARVRTAWAMKLHREQRDEAGPTSADRFEQLELEQAVESAIARLPERRRQVFCLARLHGMKYTEIAAILDVAPQTVANHISNALSDLHRMLMPFLAESR
jgi:RNA polymerase sigma-70 factor (ECF subfamily)